MRNEKLLTEAITALNQSVLSLHAWLLANASAASKRDLREMEKRILDALDPVLSAGGAAALAKVKASTERVEGATERVEDATERVEDATKTTQPG